MGKYGEPYTDLLPYHADGSNQRGGYIIYKLRGSYKNPLFLGG